MFQAQQPQTNPSRGALTAPNKSPEDLAPINPIRTETVFSRFPIHQLSKKNNTPIRIIRRDSDRGQVIFRWETSPNIGYGTPRGLAFKTDKLIVDRRLNELNRPLQSRYIRLGSLRDIARELNLGGNTNKAKQALLQNAFIAISVKLTYKTQQGTEQSIEEAFTRYNLRFWRQKLEDGTKADAVYLRLNDPFFQVTNDSPTRPLDYNYLKLLPPAAQRFYELVSFRVFAALKYGHDTFKIRYSEHCLLAPQTRSSQLWKVKRQMEPIHKYHLASGYITQAQYQKTTDDQGSPDWFIFYTPGPKAFAEYETFTGKTPKSARPKAALTAARPNPESRGVDTLDPKRLTALTSRGVLKTEAVKFLSDAPEELLEHIDDSLDYFDTQPRDRMDNPGALLAELIRKKISFPETFQTRAQRRQQEAERQAELKRQQDRQHLETLYSHYKRGAVRQWVDQNVPSAEFAQQLEKTTATLAPIYTRMTPEQLRDIAKSAAYGKFQHRVPLTSFADFSADKTAQEKAQESLKTLSNTSTTEAPPTTPHRAL